MTTRLQDLQAIADLTAEVIGLPNRPQVRLKEVWSGRASRRSNAVTIPQWAVRDRPDAYAVYYTVHETCHFRERGHGNAFKAIERQALKAWGLAPVYARAYPKQLYSLAGECLYERRTPGNRQGARVGGQDVHTN